MHKNEEGKCCRTKKPAIDFNCFVLISNLITFATIYELSLRGPESPFLMVENLNK